MDRRMLHYYTSARIKQTFREAEALGINTVIARADHHIMRLLMEYWDEEGSLQWIAQTCPELGSIEHVIDICRRTKNTEPVINWGNVHARGAGYLKGQSDYKNVIEQVRQGFGQGWLRNAYFFFTGVKYGPSGKIGQIPFRDSDLRLNDLIRSILSYGIRGTIIFDDPSREQDIVKMLDDLGDMVR